MGDPVDELGERAVVGGEARGGVLGAGGEARGGVLGASGVLLAAAGTAGTAATPGGV